MMEQQKGASDSDQTSRKPSKGKGKDKPYVFEQIPTVDETALSNLFDHLRVETK